MSVYQITHRQHDKHQQIGPEDADQPLRHGNPNSSRNSPHRGRAATDNAYVLIEVGQTPSSQLDQLNDYVGRQGYHGHGDNLFVMALPETLHNIHVELWPVSNLTDEEKTALVTTTEQMIRAAFRESADYPAVTRTWPSARFSFSLLGHEPHGAMPSLTSLHFAETDIIAHLEIPRLQLVEVTLHE